MASKPRPLSFGFSGHIQACRVRLWCKRSAEGDLLSKKQAAKYQKLYENRQLSLFYTPPLAAGMVHRNKLI
jgi:hypothetical protein